MPACGRGRSHSGQDRQSLPGWSKAPGEVTRAIFTLVNKSQTTRFEDIVIEATNARSKAWSRSIPRAKCSRQISRVQPFEPGQGDAQGRRGPDGALRSPCAAIFMTAAPSSSRRWRARQRQAAARQGHRLDVKLGTVAWISRRDAARHDLRASRRGGIINNFALHCQARTRYATAWRSARAGDEWPPGGVHRDK